MSAPRGRITGMRHTIYEHPITHKFALIRLPENFGEGDAIPLRPADRWFDTRNGPVAALSELLDQDE